ncbi:MAG TPA: MCE family protein [Mycobacteriales bacterium]|nr:MCE family protein [Mycobacteriales bacterium]
MSRARVLAALAGVVALAIVVAAVAVGIHVVRGGKRIHITAYFTESNGIYAGNHVDILGLPIGSVSSVTPEPDRVKVVLSLPAGTKVPVDAQAYIVPPSVISDRYVGLSPAWNGSGRTMPDGYVLPVGRTHEPAEFDQLVGSLTTLFNALGPKQAGAKGAVGRLIKVLSANLDGNGAALHESVEGLASATGALAGDRGAFTDVITSLDQLSSNLAKREGLISSFDSDLAGASKELAKERGDITGVVDNLSTGLISLASFLRSHRATLHGDLHDLVVTTNVLLQHQRALIETLDNLPLATQNLARVNHGGAILTRHADLGQNEFYNSTVQKICKALGPVCSLLTGLGDASSGATTNAAPQDLAALFEMTP